MLLIEPHSHFHHLFTFPRFAIVPNEEHKAFIPYSGTFTPKEQSTPHAIVPARVVSLEPHSLKLDRQWQGSDRIEFDYLVVATGSTLTQPSGLPFDQKLPSVEYLRKHQQQVKLAKSILIVGGGAAGVQMATDLKEYYPDKQVTLVHSREHLMPKFHTAFHDLIKKRFDELGINLIAGTRVVVPEGGFSTTSSTQEIKFKNGGSTVADFVILTTGQQPNNSLLKNLDRSLQDSVLNPETGFIRIRPTMQFAHPELSHLFAVGDIADTGAHKAARPGMLQADAVTANIRAMIEGETPGETFTAPPAAIHMTLGMVSLVLDDEHEVCG